MRGVRGRNSFFAVYADDLLLSRDDAGFDNGRNIRGLNEAVRCDSLLRQKVSQPGRCEVVPNQAADLNRMAEMPKVTSNVGGAAGVKGFSLHFNNRYRSLRRDPGNLPQTNSSSITSPMTNRRCVRARARRCCILSAFI